MKILKSNEAQTKKCYEYCLHINKKSLETEKGQYDDSCIKTHIQDLEIWKKLSGRSGPRSDLIKLTEMVKDGATDLEIMNEYLSQFMLYSSTTEPALVNWLL